MPTFPSLTTSVEPPTAEGAALDGQGAVQERYAAAAAVLEEIGEIGTAPNGTNLRRFCLKVPIEPSHRRKPVPRLWHDRASGLLRNDVIIESATANG